jgi:hypothetical protein
LDDLFIIFLKLKRYELIFSIGDNLHRICALAESESLAKAEIISLYQHNKLQQESGGFDIVSVEELDQYGYPCNPERVCEICNKYMYEGYCIENGLAYYCSDECLQRHYTKTEWDEMTKCDGDSYWTEWK